MRTLTELAQDESKWDILAEGRYNRVFRSKGPLIIENRQQEWVLKCPLSACGLLITALDLSVHENCTSILKSMDRLNVQFVLIRAKKFLYIAEKASQQFYLLKPSATQLMEFDQALNLLFYQHETVYRLMTSDLGKISHLLSALAPSFKLFESSSCDQDVLTWNNINPSCPAYSVNQYCWIAPFVGQTPANDQDIEQTILQTFKQTGLVLINACDINNVLMFKGRAVYVAPHLAIQGDSLLGRTSVVDLLEYDDFFNRDKPRVSQLIRTLVYLSRFLLHDCVKDERFLSSKILPLLHFFQNKNYPITEQILCLLHALAITDSVDLNNYQERCALSKIGQNYYTTLIMYYVANKSAHSLGLLLKSKPRLCQPEILNAVNCDGSSALMLAVAHQRTDFVVLLLQYNVRLDTCNKNVCNALDLALGHFSVSDGSYILRLLLVQGVKLSHENQCEWLAKVSNGIYKNILQFTLSEYPQYFKELVVIASRDATWMNEIRAMLQLQDHLSTLKFDDYLHHLKSKVQSGHHFQHRISVLCTELSQLKRVLITTQRESLDNRLCTFKFGCDDVLMAFEHYVASHPAPQAPIFLFSFLNFSDDLMARHHSFKKRLNEWWNPDCEYVFVNSRGDTCESCVF